MTEVLLQLKKRHPYPKGANVNVSVEWLRKLMSVPEDAQGKNGKDVLWETLTTQLETLPEVHDKVWLEVICNWSPPEGLSLIQQAPWIRFAMRVLDLDDSIEGGFSLSEKDASMIWNRLVDERFKVRRDPAFDGFIMDLMDAFGKELPEAVAG